jgi:purine-binding chemotaxis protein CheW
MRFGIEPMEVTDSSRIVIIEAGGQVVGILVDSVAEVVDLSVDDIDPAPNIGTEESAQFIKGVANLGQELLIIIDLNKLLTADEWDEISRI